MKTFESNWERDGINFYMQGWEPEDGKPKAVVGLVHGLGEHSGRYAHVGAAYTKAGYALTSFDLRGHGRSGGSRGHFPSLDAVMRDIRQFFAQIGQRYPGKPQFLYGHSLGGLLALAYSLRFREGLKGAIVTGPGLRSALQEQKAKLAMVNMLGPLLPTLTVPCGLETAAISRDPQVVEKYRQDPYVHDKTSLGLGKSGLEAIAYCFAHAAEYPIPLLLMHGAADTITYPSGSEAFADLAKTSNRDITVKLWSGLYHEIHNEPEQAEVFKTGIEWLSRHL
jgi:alpha-beta hydrolase superfamily lysophospholipase